MEGIEDLDVQVGEELSGVWDVKRIDNGDGNWRGPPHPDHLRGVHGGDIVDMVIGSDVAL